MKKLLLIFIALTIALISPSCGPKARYTTKVVKPKYHHRWYDRKNDRQTARTKTVKVKN